MRMTEKVIAIGSLLLLAAAAFSVAILPALTFNIKPSEAARKRTPEEELGRLVYMQNGCTYCHSQYVRPQDWGHSAVRVSEAGDYVYDFPHLLGSLRNGPDLSQEGGVRTDDWHIAHFWNPRYTRPASIMPSFKQLNEKEITALVAYMQSLGGTDADARMARLRKWNAAMKAAYRLAEERGNLDYNWAYVHSLVPPEWRTMPNPYPATEEALARGKYVYQQSCVGCHGIGGDGDGPAAKYLYPPPANFNSLRRVGASGGLLYYQIMNGITGTAMMSFKRELESEKIWDVSNYIAREFIGRDDANTAPRGVDEVYEPVDPNEDEPPPVTPDIFLPPTSPELQPEVDATQRRSRQNGAPRSCANPAPPAGNLPPGGTGATGGNR